MYLQFETNKRGETRRLTDLEVRVWVQRVVAWECKNELVREGGDGGEGNPLRCW